MEISKEEKEAIEKLEKERIVNHYIYENDFASKEEIKKLKEKVHEVLDGNGITRAYQLEIDRYFDEILED